jgi:hypothetical protein
VGVSASRAGSAAAVPPSAARAVLAVSDQRDRPSAPACVACAQRSCPSAGGGAAFGQFSAAPAVRRRPSPPAAVARSSSRRARPPRPPVRRPRPGALTGVPGRRGRPSAPAWVALAGAVGRPLPAREALLRRCRPGARQPLWQPRPRRPSRRAWPPRSDRARPRASHAQVQLAGRGQAAHLRAGSASCGACRSPPRQHLRRPWPTLFQPCMAATLARARPCVACAGSVLAVRRRVRPSSRRAWPPRSPECARVVACARCSYHITYSSLDPPNALAAGRCRDGTPRPFL